MANSSPAPPPKSSLDFDSVPLQYIKPLPVDPPFQEALLRVLRDATSHAMTAIHQSLSSFLVLPQNAVLILCINPNVLHTPGVCLSLP